MFIKRPFERLIMKRVKVMAIGDDGIGKTMLMNELGGSASSNRNNSLASTSFVKMNNLKLMLCDSCHDGDYLAMQSILFDDVDIFLLCFALDKPESLQHLLSFYHHVAESSKKNVRIMVGLRSDLENRVSREEIYEIGLSIMSMAYFEYSGSSRRQLLIDLIYRICNNYLFR